MRCPACSAENAATHRFCGQCGAVLGTSCPSCGADADADMRFCGQCGTALGAAPPEASVAAAAPEATTTAERRLVSVLFVDLVGFTTLSEDRDPEAVRELLSDYFDESRTIVRRYGGTIEKFIGDAVMAVWGTPTALEDDAERAVRAGLDLVDAVAALGEREGLGGLRARAGIVTGDAAVNLAAVGQGMVAGDVVNTAARVQAAAQPGVVLVDERTRAATSSAIAYSAAGEHELKGKVGPVALFEVVQVAAGSGGAQRFDGLEAPFAGRERELRLVKELFHDSAERSRARLVLVTGIAGVGKSRLGWELWKYIDGISSLNLWHVGRCLSYGEGVAYWALAEMMRMRLRVTDGDTNEAILRKLTEGIATFVDDDEERRWLIPRLAVLLGIGELVDLQPSDLQRESLFAGWRLFIERMAQQTPVVLVVEDLHFADSGLLDFLEYLLDWSTGLPIFILGLARPEFHERRPEFGAHRRNVTSLYVEPLGGDVIEAMVDALVAGLPDATRRALAARAEGIPLFAIETIRMLIDRDLVIPREGEYVLASAGADLGELDVPPTLQALVAARLDNLPEAERRLVKDASVLGLSFTLAAAQHLVGAVGSLDPQQVEDLLTSLTRKEVLTAQTDVRSLEAGQYRFVQRVMHSVAYDTLSRRDRKARHLAIAGYLAEGADADEMAGVIAAHYLDAADAVPDETDAEELRSAARQHMERAGDRARDLGSTDEAQRYYERALDLAADDDQRARLAELAGIMAHRAGRLERALEHLVTARRVVERGGDVSVMARVAASEGDVLTSLGRVDESLELMRTAYGAIEGHGLHVDVARLANGIATAALGSSAYHGEADRWLDVALSAAEAAGAWDVLTRSLNVKGIRLAQSGNPVQGRAYITAALEIALEHDMPYRAAIQHGNLALIEMHRDLDRARGHAQRSLEHARRIGDAGNESLALQARALIDLHAGRWHDVRASEELLPPAHLPMLIALERYLPLVACAVWAGDDLPALHVDLDASPDDPQARATLGAIRALVAASRGDLDQALAEGSTAVEVAVSMSVETDEFAMSWPTAVDAALALGDTARARELVEIVRRRPAGHVPRLTRGLVLWLHARVAAAEGAADVTEHFGAAARLLREHGALPWLGRCLLDHAEWLADRGEPRDAGTLAGEAAAILTAVGATPFLHRAERLAGTTTRAPGPEVAVAD